MPDGHFDNPARLVATDCVFDGCPEPGVLYAQGIRCPEHQPNAARHHPLTRDTTNKPKENQ